MRRLTTLLLLGVTLAAGAAMTADDVMKSILALEEDELVSLRMALAEDERVEEIDRLLASADSDQREQGAAPTATRTAPIAANAHVRTPTSGRRVGRVSARQRTRRRNTPERRRNPT